MLLGTVTHLRLFVPALILNSSARTDQSSTRIINAAIEQALLAKGMSVNTRDLVNGVPFVDQHWVAAGNIEPDQWTADIRQARQVSDDLIDEALVADVWVIAAPMYNFTVPACLKAWFDQICRGRSQFKAPEQAGRRAILVIGTGGVAVNSATDFATPWLMQVMDYLGIENVQVIAADRQMMEDGRVEAALTQVDGITAEI